MTLEEKIQKLPPKLQQETEDFVEFLLKREASQHQSKTEERNLGSLRGTVKNMASDFDEPLTEFEDYMAKEKTDK